MKIFLFVWALLSSSYFHPSHGASLTKVFGDCAAGEYKTIEVTCTDGCKGLTASAFYDAHPRGVVHILGRSGGEPYEDTTCNNDCFCKGDVDVASQQQCHKTGNPISGSKINFVLRCEVASFNVWLQLNVNGRFGNPQVPNQSSNNCTLPTDHNGPKACALTVGHLAVMESRHYTFTCNGDCRFRFLFTEFDNLGDVDLYLGETIFDDGDSKCSVHNCFCSATSGHPTEDHCVWQKRITKDKVIFTVRAYMPSSSVVVYYNGNNIKSVEPYNPQNVYYISGNNINFK